MVWGTGGSRGSSNVRALVSMEFHEAEFRLALSPDTIKSPYPGQRKFP